MAQKIFVVDRLYSVALGVPPTLVDDHRPRTRIQTPLPGIISAFQSNVCFSARGGSHSLDILWEQDHGWGEANSPLSTFFNGSHSQNSADLTEAHVIALYAKISELFERAGRLSYASSTGSAIRFYAPPEIDIPYFWKDDGFVALENSLSEAWTALPLTNPPHNGLDFIDGSLSYSLMTLRSLVHASTVQLHRQLSLKELSSHAKSLAAAEHIITIIRECWDADFAYFDPILGVSLPYSSLAMRH